MIKFTQHTLLIYFMHAESNTVVIATDWWHNSYFTLEVMSDWSLRNFAPVHGSWSGQPFTDGKFVDNKRDTFSHSYYLFIVYVYPKDEKAPQTLEIPLQWRRSKWSQEMFTCPGPTFSYGLDELIYCCDTCLTGLVTMWGSKANMRLYLYLMSCSVSYFI
jgi:hypothetical protein